MIPISGFYIALTALPLLVLAFKVVQQRQKLKIGLVDGGEKAITVAMRAQANAVETAVPTLLLLLVAELNGASGWFVHLMGAAYLFSRVFHAYGFTKSEGKTHPGRYYGTLINWIVMVLLIGWALFYFAISLNAS